MIKSTFYLSLQRITVSQKKNIFVCLFLLWCSKVISPAIATYLIRLFTVHVIQVVAALKRAYTELGSACLFSLQYLISLIKYKSQTKIV